MHRTASGSSHGLAITAAVGGTAVLVQLESTRHAAHRAHRRCLGSDEWRLTKGIPIEKRLLRNSLSWLGVLWLGMLWLGGTDGNQFSAAGIRRKHATKGSGYVLQRRSQGVASVVFFSLRALARTNRLTALR